MGVVDWKPWYDGLVKPSFTPAEWFFGPVWTVLYTMMSITAWMVWLSPPTPCRQMALALFALHLLINAAWTPVFFGLQSLGGALAIVVLLWLLVALVWARFWRISKPAGGLLLPYWAWVSFAALLNLEIWRLNR